MKIILGTLCEIVKRETLEVSDIINTCIWKRNSLYLKKCDIKNSILTWMLSTSLYDFVLNWPVSIKKQSLNLIQKGLLIIVSLVVWKSGYILFTCPVSSMNPARLMELQEMEEKLSRLPAFLWTCGLSVKLFLILPRMDFAFFRWTIIAVICWAKDCLANTVLLDRTICVVLFLYTGLINEMAHKYEGKYLKPKIRKKVHWNRYTAIQLEWGISELYHSCKIFCFI